MASGGGEGAVEAHAHLRGAHSSALGEGPPLLPGWTEETWSLLLLGMALSTLFSWIGEALSCLIRRTEMHLEREERREAASRMQVDEADCALFSQEEKLSATAIRIKREDMKPVVLFEVERSSPDERPLVERRSAAAVLAVKISSEE
ncbi:MAG: hypothetical protein SGPRY_007924 [Prymnesium sp.]